MKIKPVIYLLNNGSYIGNNPFIFLKIDGWNTPANTQGVYLFPIDFVIEKYKNFPTFGAFFNKYARRSLWLVERCVNVTTDAKNDYGKPFYTILPDLAQTFEYNKENAEKFDTILQMIGNTDRIIYSDDIDKLTLEINQYFFNK